MDEKKEKESLRYRGLMAATANLARCGLVVDEMDYRVPAGKVDIVAWDGSDLVLVDVFTSKTIHDGTDVTVGLRRQRTLAKIADAYLAYTGGKPRLIRYDRITLRVLSEDRALLRHYRNVSMVRVKE